MNLTAIDAEISKAIRKGSRIIYGMYDDETVGISTNGLLLYLIPKNQFIFDMKDKPSSNIKAMIPPDYDFEDAVMSGNQKVLDSGNTASQLKSKHHEAWINPKLLKNFSKSAKFRIKGKKTIVYIYEGEQLTGAVMPIIIKGE